MKNINITKGFYRVKIYIKGNEGYGWDDPAEVFHLDYTSVVEIKLALNKIDLFKSRLENIKEDFKKLEK